MNEKVTHRKDTPLGQFRTPTPTMKETWDKQKAALIKKYPHLTESDLRYGEGKKGVMWENIQAKLGLSKEELRKLIESV